MNNHKPNTVLVIVGPTAVGKTAFAIQLAQYFNTQIISADSRQCFKEMGIGTAKPSVEQLCAVPHHFINSHSVTEEVNAGTYEQYALQAAGHTFQHNNLAVMVGGTGLYIKAFCEGIDPMPTIPIALRKNIMDQYNLHGLAWLQNELKTKDTLFWNGAEQQNPQRLMRALEVLEATGQSIVFYRKKTRVERPFNIVKIGLQLPRQQLIGNINIRVGEMVANGLLDEVVALKKYQHLNALQTVGYKEMFDHLDGNISLPQAIEQIKINTRQYAKRQMTWFKKDQAIHWATNHGAVLQEVVGIVSSSIGKL